MKKVSVVLLIVVFLVFGLSACKKSEETPELIPAETVEPTESAPAEESAPEADMNTGDMTTGDMPAVITPETHSPRFIGTLPPPAGMENMAPGEGLANSPALNDPLGPSTLEIPPADIPAEEVPAESNQQ